MNVEMGVLDIIITIIYSFIIHCFINYFQKYQGNYQVLKIEFIIFNL